MKTGGFARRAFAGVALIGWAALVHAQSGALVAFSPAATAFTGELTVQLSGAGSGQEIRYVIASGPGAAAAEVTRESPVYEGPIRLDRTSLIRAAVFPVDGGGAGRTSSGHYLKLDASLAGFSSQLPVVVLDVLGAGPLEQDDINHASWIFGYAPGEGPTFGGAPAFATPLTASVRGSSSAGFAKKGYNIRLQDAAGRNRAAPLFDLPAYERWALVAPWAFDPNLINNAFVYALSNRIGRWAPRTKLVELFFNPGGDDLDLNDYGGVYVITDRIRAEPGRVDIDRLDDDDHEPPAITGGYILQFNPPDPDDISWLTNRGVPEQDPSQLIIVEPDAEDVTPAQLSYIKNFIQEMEDALHADRATGFAQRTYLDYIDRSAWVDHHLLNVLVSNPDALIRSAYFTKPRGGRLQAGPVWDFDRALGGFRDDRTSVLDSWSGENTNVDVWQAGWWGVLAEDPDFVQEWIGRWQSLRRAELSTAALAALAQDLANTIGTAAAHRDWDRWPDTASPLGSYTAQIEALKSWLAQRASWIDSQFVAPPEVSADAGAVTFTPPSGALLAYTANGSDPRLPGGDVSPDAEMHAGPLTVPAGANLRVRSFDPTPVDRFPSSPWSALVANFTASPITLPGRIVNLSSKAAVAGAEPLIIGFVVESSDTKRYLVRAIGPTLGVFGEAEPLGDPRLLVTSATGVMLAQNERWQTAATAGQLPALSAALGAFPLAADSRDSAAIIEAPGGGNYTVQLTSAAGQGGVVLGELYAADRDGRTANVSIRGRATSEQPLTGGFVIADGANRVLIRAVGPTLREFGVTDAMPDPTLTLRGGAVVIASNDSWMSGANGPAIEESSARAGAFPLPPGSQDAAVVLNLPAGAYTVEVRAARAGGSVLLEIYDVP